MLSNRKALIIANIGVFLIVLGLGVQSIDYQDQIDRNQEEIINLQEKLDKALIEIDRLEAENDSLWSNYYMNVSNYEGYEYYE